MEAIGGSPGSNIRYRMPSPSSAGKAKKPLSTKCVFDPKVRKRPSSTSIPQSQQQPQQQEQLEQQNPTPSVANESGRKPKKPRSNTTSAAKERNQKQPQSLIVIDENESRSASPVVFQETPMKKKVKTSPNKETKPKEDKVENPVSIPSVVVTESDPKKVTRKTTNPTTKTQNQKEVVVEPDTINNSTTGTKPSTQVSAPSTQSQNQRAKSITNNRPQLNQSQSKNSKQAEQQQLQQDIQSNINIQHSQPVNNSISNNKHNSNNNNINNNKNTNIHNNNNNINQSSTNNNNKNQNTNSDSKKITKNYYIEQVNMDNEPFSSSSDLASLLNAIQQNNASEKQMTSQDHHQPDAPQFEPTFSNIEEEPYEKAQENKSIKTMSSFPSKEKQNIHRKQEVSLSFSPIRPQTQVKQQTAIPVVISINTPSPVLLRERESKPSTPVNLLPQPQPAPFLSKDKIPILSDQPRPNTKPTLPQVQEVPLPVEPINPQQQQVITESAQKTLSQEYTDRVNQILNQDHMKNNNTKFEHVSDSKMKYQQQQQSANKQSNQKQNNFPSSLPSTNSSMSTRQQLQVLNPHPAQKPVIGGTSPNHPNPQQQIQQQNLRSNKKSTPEKQQTLPSSTQSSQKKQPSQNNVVLSTPANSSKKEIDQKQQLQQLSSEQSTSSKSANNQTSARGSSDPPRKTQQNVQQTERARFLPPENCIIELTSSSNNTSDGSDSDEDDRIVQAYLASLSKTLNNRLLQENPQPSAQAPLATISPAFGIMFQEQKQQQPVQQQKDTGQQQQQQFPIQKNNSSSISQIKQQTTGYKNSTQESDQNIQTPTLGDCVSGVEIPFQTQQSSEKGEQEQYAFEPEKQRVSNQIPSRISSIWGKKSNQSIPSHEQQVNGIAVKSEGAQVLSPPSSLESGENKILPSNQQQHQIPSSNVQLPVSQKMPSQGKRPSLFSKFEVETQQQLVTAAQNSVSSELQNQNSLKNKRNQEEIQHHQEQLQQTRQQSNLQSQQPDSANSAQINSLATSNSKRTHPAQQFTSDQPHKRFKSDPEIPLGVDARIDTRKTQNIPNSIRTVQERPQSQKQLQQELVIIDLDDYSDKENDHEEEQEEEEERKVACEESKQPDRFNRSYKSSTSQQIQQKQQHLHHHQPHKSLKSIENSIIQLSSMSSLSNLEFDDKLQNSRNKRREGIAPRVLSDRIATRTFHFNGTLACIDNKVAETLIRKQRGFVSEYLSTSVNFSVIGSIDSSDSLIEQAILLRIRLIQESDFSSMLTQSISASEALEKKLAAQRIKEEEEQLQQQEYQKQYQALVSSKNNLNNHSQKSNTTPDKLVQNNLESITGVVGTLPSDILRQQQQQQKKKHFTREVLSQTPVFLTELRNNQNNQETQHFNLTNAETSIPVPIQEKTKNQDFIEIEEEQQNGLTSKTPKVTPSRPKSFHSANELIHSIQIEESKSTPFASPAPACERRSISPSPSGIVNYNNNRGEVNQIKSNTQLNRSESNLIEKNPQPDNQQQQPQNNLSSSSNLVTSSRSPFNFSRQDRPQQIIISDTNETQQSTMKNNYNSQYQQNANPSTQMSQHPQLVNQSKQPYSWGPKNQSSQPQSQQQQIRPSYIQSQTQQEYRKSNSQMHDYPQQNLQPTSHLWTDKHAPVSLEECVGNSSALQKLSQWLRNWTITQPQRACLLSGPPGIGKTSSVRLIAKQLQYSLIEWNASDVRNKAALDEELTPLKDNQVITLQQQQSGIGMSISQGAKSNPRVLILMDEVDGMSSGDIGGTQFLLKVIKDTKHPIFCVCNDRYSQKIKSLAAACFDVRFYKPTKVEIAKRLSKVCAKESIKFDTASLELLAEKSNADIRSSLNILQMQARKSINDQRKPSPYSSGLSVMRESLNTCCKDDTVGITAFEACRTLITKQEFSRLSIDQRMDLFFLDYEFLPLLMHENYLSAMTLRATKPPFLADVSELEDIVAATNAFAEFDILGNCIRSGQNWSLLNDQGFLSTVYAPSKVSTRLNCGFPQMSQLLGKFSSQRKNTRLAKELRVRISEVSSGNRQAVQFEYSKALIEVVMHALETKGKDAIDEVIALLESYRISPDVLKEHLVSLQFGVAIEARFKEIPTLIKTALTRAYNKKNSSGGQNAAGKRGGAGAFDDMNAEIAAGRRFGEEYDEQLVDAKNDDDHDDSDEMESKKKTEASMKSGPSEKKGNTMMASSTQQQQKKQPAKSKQTKKAPPVQARKPNKAMESAISRIKLFSDD